jgi:hypothetical protein
MPPHYPQYPQYSPPPPERVRGNTKLIVGLVTLVGFAMLCGVCGLFAFTGFFSVRDLRLHGAPGVSGSPVVIDGHPVGPTAGPGAPAPGAGAAQGGLNQPVRSGNIEFVVTKVDCGHPDIPEAPAKLTAKGQFCLVDMSLHNVGSSAEIYFDSYDKAISPTGETFGTNSTAGIYAGSGDHHITVGNLEAGEKISGTTVFDIAKDATIARLELRGTDRSPPAVVTVG